MKHFYIFILLFFPLMLMAQERDIPQNIENNSAQILEYTNKPQKAVFAKPLKLQITLPEALSFDGENTSQKDFEVLSLSANKKNPLLLEMTVLPLNLHISTLTALGFTSSTGEKFQTEPLEIEVEEIPSKMKELIDIRGPFRPFNILPYLLIILSVAAIIYTIIYFKRRKKVEEPLLLTPYQKQERPMHEIALSQLDILIQSDLWAKSQYKLYYSEISDIIRQFLSARFGFEAEKMTARELAKKLKTIQDFKFDFNELQKFQQEIILVKFAKSVPTIEERDSTLNTAKNIILSNKEKDLSRYQNNKAEKTGEGNEKIS